MTTKKTISLRIDRTLLSNLKKKSTKDGKPVSELLAEGASFIAPSVPQLEFEKIGCIYEQALRMEEYIHQMYIQNPLTTADLLSIVGDLKAALIEYRTKEMTAIVKKR